MQLNRCMDGRTSRTAGVLSAKLAGVTCLGCSNLLDINIYPYIEIDSYSFLERYLRMHGCMHVWTDVCSAGAHVAGHIVGKSQESSGVILTVFLFGSAPLFGVTESTWVLICAPRACVQRHVMQRNAK